jgi:hypothetical protein
MVFRHNCFSHIWGANLAFKSFKTWSLAVDGLPAESRKTIAHLSTNWSQHFSPLYRFAQLKTRLTGQFNGVQIFSLKFMDSKRWPHLPEVQSLGLRSTRLVLATKWFITIISPGTRDPCANKESFARGAPNLIQWHLVSFSLIEPCPSGIEIACQHPPSLDQYGKYLARKPQQKLISLEQGPPEDRDSMIWRAQVFCIRRPVRDSRQH